MPKKTDQIIDPLDAEFEDVARAVVRRKLGATENTNENNELAENQQVLGAMQQQTLFHVEKQVEIDDIEMGVLESGVPYLTGRGLEPEAM